MTVIQRELPLVRVRCACRPYVVSVMHPVPRCTDCGLTPTYDCDTLWYLGVDDE